MQNQIRAQAVPKEEKKHETNNNYIVLNDRFMLSKQIEKGGFGSVFLATDLQNMQEVIVKFNSQAAMNMHEVLILKAITLNKCYGFPQLIDYGTTKQKIPDLIEDEQGAKPDEHHFLVLSKLGMSIKRLIRMRKGPFTTKTVAQIGLQCIDRLKTLHDLGFVHNDLKPDNILLRTMKPNDEGSDEIFLIDFGITKRYMTSSGQHIKQLKKIEFAGNVIFASKNAFLGIQQSRRDDFISLCYMMIFLVSGKVPWVSRCQDEHDSRKFFRAMAKRKLTMTASQICTNKAAPFLEFTKYVYDLTYEQQPHYERLKHMLRKIILGLDFIPNNVFDWNVDYMMRKNKFDKKKAKPPRKLIKFDPVNGLQMKKVDGEQYEGSEDSVRDDRVYKVETPQRIDEPSHSHRSHMSDEFDEVLAGNIANEDGFVCGHIPVFQPGKHASLQEQKGKRRDVQYSMRNGGQKELKASNMRGDLMMEEKKSHRENRAHSELGRQREPTNQNKFQNQKRHRDDGDISVGNYSASVSDNSNVQSFSNVGKNFRAGVSIFQGLSDFGGSQLSRSPSQFSDNSNNNSHNKSQNSVIQWNKMNHRPNGGGYGKNKGKALIHFDNGPQQSPNSYFKNQQANPNPNKKRGASIQWNNGNDQNPEPFENRSSQMSDLSSQLALNKKQPQGGKQKPKGRINIVIE